MTHAEALWILAAIIAFILLVKTKAFMLFFIPWLWIPADEEHPTYMLNELRLDPFGLGVPRWVFRTYCWNLTWRRNVAHRRDMRKRA